MRCGRTVKPVFHLDSPLSYIARCFYRDPRMMNEYIIMYHIMQSAETINMQAVCQSAEHEHKIRQPLGLLILPQFGLRSRC
jgi:hypothetical protein